MKYILCILGVLISLVALPTMAGPSSPSDYPGCVYNASPPSLAPGQVALLQCDINGNVKYTPAGSGAPQPITPAACAWTYTSVTLAAATSATILAAGSYKAVIVQNVGANPVNRMAAGTGAITASSAGIALDAATSPNVQGGSYTFPLPPSNAVQAISTAGTTVTVGTCS